MTHSFTSRNFGSSLVEVLVSLFILSIGLLGMLSVQSYALKENHVAYLYSQAAILASDMYENLSVFPRAIVSFQAGIDAQETVAARCDRQFNLCVKSESLDDILSAWQKRIENTLPEGKGFVSKDKKTYVIGIDFLVGYDANRNAMYEKYQLNANVGG